MVLGAASGVSIRCRLHDRCGSVQRGRDARAIELVSGHAADQTHMGPSVAVFAVSRTAGVRREWLSSRRVLRAWLAGSRRRCMCPGPFVRRRCLSISGRWSRRRGRDLRRSIGQLVWAAGVWQGPRGELASVPQAATRILCARTALAQVAVLGEAALDAPSGGVGTTPTEPAAIRKPDTR